MMIYSLRYKYNYSIISECLICYLVPECPSAVVPSNFYTNKIQDPPCPHLQKVIFIL